MFFWSRREGSPLTPAAPRKNQKESGWWRGYVTSVCFHAHESHLWRFGMRMFCPDRSHWDEPGILHKDIDLEKLLQMDWKRKSSKLRRSWTLPLKELSGYKKGRNFTLELKQKEGWGYPESTFSSPNGFYDLFVNITSCWIWCWAISNM